MQIRLAHLGTQGIDFAVFAADSRCHSRQGRQRLLSDLTVAARQEGLNVNNAALAYTHAGRTEYFGTPDLVDYLANNGVSHWTHTITV